MQASTTIVRHRARMERDGSFAILRATRLVDARGDDIRRGAAIVMDSLPNGRLARALARVQHRMREVEA